MKTTNHQFKHLTIYIPNWKINTLFIGTFNPEFGEKVNYYYGRPKNRFWKLISELTGKDIHPNDKEFFLKIKNSKIGCIDLIDNVSYLEEKHLEINGKGYSDQIILKNDVIKSYNTNIIIDLIKLNNLNEVYITRNVKGFRKEQLIEIKKIKKFSNVIYLSSPSPINPNRNLVMNDWKTKIDTF